MEEIKAPITIFQPERISPSISQWKLGKTLLEIYYEDSGARQFIEDLATCLGLKMGLEQLRKHLEDIEKFEKEVEKNNA